MTEQRRLSRRTVVKGAAAVASATLMSRVLQAEAAAAPRGESRPGTRIDRFALVSRHRVVRHRSDLELPVQVGNGRFAFGADVTGLQTFVPFNTLSDWGWHVDALPPGKQISDYRGTIWDTYGRDVYYWTDDDNEPELHNWLRENPHRANLGRIGLRLLKEDGSEAVEADLTDIVQELDPWTGVLRSAFRLEGHRVAVETACHPGEDVVAARISSDLIRLGRLTVFLEFPYATAAGRNKFEAPYVGFYDRPELHSTELRRQGRAAIVTHTMDATRYQVGLNLSAGARVSRPDPARHRYEITGGGDHLDVAALFAPEIRGTVPVAAEVVRQSEHWWPRYWRTGGAVDLSRSGDPRWRELERRIVLSQYHLAVNDAGNDPAQESGLVNNGWYGKFHMEMYWWHAFQYALWNRWPLLDRSTDVYERFLPKARELAKSQGFRGARWPKMTTTHGDAIGRESPGTPTCLLIWQQPHPIFLAELDYQAHPGRRTLLKWREVVHESAEFIASFANREESGRFVIGPPIMCCNERNPSAETMNPAFELSYWRFGLRIAQAWRERLGTGREPYWDEVLGGLAPLPVEDGVYVLYEGVPNMWTERNTNHPDPIAPFGMLPGDGVDVETMRATTRKVYETWPVTDLYSWDFPLLAMNAARLGDPATAVDYLLHERLGFTDTGLPASGKSGVPSPYFPSAGGLLYAVAMMCAGWGDSPEGPSGEAGRPGPDGTAPGFPDQGWVVHWEDLAPAL
ncbi:hypothetical protein [Prauserella endophytica]|uniref:Glycoside hydrolase family 65 n=1 Tax=Prauserella endophytica TaxID=1592324 RepID=A0ABY2SAB3_9PSEU|nr:hypothetical protein [Prauserella endophytica]TKG72817.1 hypothetical protein FCN18_06230 [Prauserella endophytica]